MRQLVKDTSVGKSPSVLWETQTYIFHQNPMDLAMWAKLQKISTQYDDFPHKKTYHKKGPWKLYGNPNYVFSDTKINSVICT